MKARKLPSGNYNVQYYYTDIEGNKKRGSITRPTKAEAEYEGNRIKMENTNVLGGDVKLMVNKAIKDKAAVLSPSTLRGYKKVLKNAIEGSPFGKVSLSTINTVQVQAWITWMVGMGYSPKSVKNAYGVFLSSYKFCGGTKQFLVKLPRQAKKRKHVPSKADVKKLVDYFENDPDMKAAVTLCAFAGLRRGEACALTAKDVNRKLRIIRVNKAVAETPDREWVVKTPKTTSSIRSVPVSEKVIAALPTEGKCVNINPGMVTNRFLRAIDDLGVEHFSLHDLRHFYASLSHSLGVSDMTTSSNGGWSSPAIIHDTYLGDIEEERRRQTAVLNDYIDEFF